MKKYSKLTYFVALIAALVTTACSDDFGSKEIPQEELYTRAFIKEFGIFDANHTWCAATPTQITINPQSLISDVKVYSRTDGKYYYVAHYTDVYKTTTITFDAPRGTTDLKIIADGTTYYAQAGTTLSLSGTSKSRTVITGDGSYPFTVTTVDCLELTNSQLELITNTLPEETYNMDKVTQDFYYTTRAKYYNSFTIYPVYWDTSQNLQLGIYLLDEDGNAITDGDGNIQAYYISQPKNGGELWKTTSQRILEGWISVDENELKTIWEAVYGSDNTPTNWKALSTDEINQLYAALKSSSQSIVTGDFTYYWAGSFDNYVNYTSIRPIEVSSFEVAGSWSDTDRVAKDKDNQKGNSSTDYCFYIKFSSNDLLSWTEVKSDASYDASALKWKSQGIKIQFDEQTSFGMCIKRSTDNIVFYSQSVYNPKNRLVGLTSSGSNKWDSSLHAVHAATFTCDLFGTGELARVLGFEDWPTKDGGDQNKVDLNDFVCFIQPNTLSSYDEEKDEYDEPVDDDTYNWIICAEDLGTYDDFDFNDMVLGVNYLKEGSSEGSYSKVTFTAMAAGGTLPLELHFEGTLYDSKKSESSITSDGIMYPDGCPDYKEFHQWFGEDGSIPSSKMINTNATTGGTDNEKGRTCTLYIDGDFSLKATKKGDTSGTNNSLADFYIVVNNEANASKTVIAPDIDATGKAPQMFVILDEGPNSSTYQWPKERTPIQNAYPSALDTTEGKESEWATIGFITWIRGQDTGSTWPQNALRNNTCRPWGGNQAKPQ